VTLLYLVTNEYDGTDEYGFAWNDAEAGATWPEGQPILSVRDATAPSLSEALRRIAQGQSPER
jgi:dTDP-4-dehydrorhamnose 3,5-epimerase